MNNPFAVAFTAPADIQSKRALIDTVAREMAFAHTCLGASPRSRNKRFEAEAREAFDRLWEGKTSLDISQRKRFEQDAIVALDTLSNLSRMLRPA